ncbi:MAG TPA: hypothetical protein VEC18_02835 [Myxococcota bacterium]|nr:hypothetical protein [Myxococcota bacterium]
MTALRRDWALVAAVVLVYAIGYAIYYPKIPINADEAAYLNQAVLLSRGQTVSFKIDAPTGAVLAHRASDYPLGTAALLAPFVGVAGSRGAYVAPLLCLVLGVALTARWLQDAGRSPLFALLVLGFPPTLALGRVAMSDVPSLAVVALGLWLFWRGLGGSRLAWLASGFAAGASLCIRESNALPFVGFFAGALLRRDRHSLLLVVGGIAGVALRLASSAWAFGNPLHYKSSSAVFMRHGLLDAFALQALGLLVFVPGGLLCAIAYRGARRAEVIAGCLLFSGFYLLFGYAAAELGLLNRIALGLRFYIPLLPLLAFAAAEAMPRFARSALAWAGPRRAPLLRSLAWQAIALWIGGIAIGAAAVHPILDRFTSSQLAIRDAIREHAGVDSLVLSNLIATVEYLPWLEARYGPINVADITPSQASALVRRHPNAYLVLLDKSESRFWREEAQRNAEFAAALLPTPQLELDRQLSDRERLRIWRLGP